MAITVNAVKCPSCGADLPVEEGREKIFCSFCGTPIVITNENEHIYRHIDEAKIKEAETEQMIMMRQMDMEEKSTVAKKYLIMIWIGATALLLLIGIIGMTIDNEGMGMCLLLAMNVGLWGGIGLFSTNKKKTRRYAGPNEVIISEAMEDFSEKNFNSVVMLFRGAGFSNVTAVPLNDLNMFTAKKNGQVEEVTINGSSDFSEGDVFPKTSNVLITYHSTR